MAENDNDVYLEPTVEVDSDTTTELESENVIICVSGC
jgi:hypothetical protein